MKLNALLKNSTVATTALALTFSFGAIGCGDSEDATTPVEEAEEAVEEAEEELEEAEAEEGGY